MLFDIEDFEEYDPKSVCHYERMGKVEIEAVLLWSKSGGYQFAKLNKQTSCYLPSNPILGEEYKLIAVHKGE